MDTQPDPFLSRSFKRDRIAWIVLGVLLLLLCGAGYYWAKRNVSLGFKWSGPTTADPFILVLAYDQVVEKADDVHISKAIVKSHFKALQDQGFFAVGLKDLWSFYYEQKPLPTKSVLLTFNHGYFSTYNAVDPLLRSFGWHGAISLNTKALGERYRYLLYWDRLKKMTKSGIWEIISNGHESREPIPINPQNREGHFLINRQWLTVENRPETYAEFQKRLSQDLKTGKALIADNIRNYQVTAYAAPWGRLDRLIDDRKLLDINRQTVETHFPIAFVDDYFGFNNRYTDPHRIKRLHVDKNWSGEKLVSHIKDLLASPTAGGSSAEEDNWHWQPGVGAAIYENDSLELKGTPRADVWTPGSEKAENWVVEAELELGAGQFWLVQQAMDDIKQQWRVGGNERGIYIQHRNWSQLETLASFPDPIEPGTRYQLTVIKRGRGVWVKLDGKLLTKTPVYLFDRWQGAIGWVAWNKEGESHLRITSPRLRLFPTKLSMISSKPTQKEVQKLIGKAEAIDSLIVPMWKLNGKQVQSLEVDLNLLALLARRYCWDILPMISVDSHTLDLEHSLLDSNPSDWLEQAQSYPGNHIFLNLKNGDTDKLNALEPVLDRFRNTLATTGKCLLVGVSGRVTRDAQPGTSIFNTTACRNGNSSEKL